jgi:ATP-dependent Clp protease protease subunit
VSADIERDKIFSAREALEYGLADQIIPSRKTTLAPPTGR